MTHHKLNSSYWPAGVTVKRFTQRFKKSEDCVDGVNDPIADWQVKIHHKSLVVKPRLQKSNLTWVGVSLKQFRPSLEEGGFNYIRV